ncbi:hypothetical protein [Lysinibacillus sp. BW-2-10]|uniref:hypothetical protein n=1 Tax=Lysinibacillus sp. BW-2-10 TaxID=2590030 RepID=UPI00117F6665|nr:hypothetical protein [Lysinibacillus sp. BW-2-10]TSI10769.1 hypothetical protein FJQ64_03720 [Lysinibacillus sp. BW-2-10]
MYKERIDSKIDRAIRSAGKSFLAYNLGELLNRIDELNDKNRKKKVIESLYLNQQGFYDKDISGTNIRVNTALKIISSNKVEDVLYLLLYESEKLDDEAKSKVEQTIKEIKSGYSNA